MLHAAKNKSYSLGKNISFLRVRSITNARLFLRFQRVLVKKRVLNKLCGGVVTFGTAPPPVELYRGPTVRRALKHNVSATIVAAEPGKLCLPSPQKQSRASSACPYPQKQLLAPVWRATR